MMRTRHINKLRQEGRTREVQAVKEHQVEHQPVERAVRPRRSRATQTQVEDTSKQE